VETELTKPYLISIAVHVLGLGFLFIITAPDSIDSDYSEIVRIRIQNQSMNSRFSGKVKAVSPSESNRSVRKSASIPQSWEGNVSLPLEETPLSRYSPRVVTGSELPAADVALPGVNDTIRTDSLPAVDPLAGFEDVLPAEADNTSDGLDSWSVTWAGGSSRGIVSAPELCRDDLPEETERLQNIVVRIKVSPRGDVVSAEIIPPGSGDIRIDRRIHNAALQLVLEPWPEEKGDQEGTLRLVFQEEYR